MRKVKRKLFLFLFLAGLLLLSGPRPLCAELFGDSGGLKNEGDRSVRVKITYASGAYEWVRLPRGASLDLPEKALEVVLADDDASQQLFEWSPRLKVQLFHPGGEREEMTDFGKRVSLHLKDGHLPDPEIPLRLEEETADNYPGSI